MPIRQDELISILADGRFHNGSELGARWGVSRAAISRIISRIDLPGLAIYKVRGKGYRLNERLYLLQKDAILDAMEGGLNGSITIFDIFNSIASTNNYLLEQAIPAGITDDQGYRICMSEMQYAGRGSRNKNWVSPFGNNIYLSISRKFSEGTNSLSGLSLVCGLAVIRTLHSYGIEGAGLKWPNDVQIDKKKVAGILVDVRGEALGVFQVVVGVGINLKLPAEIMKEVEQPWTSLSEYGFRMEWRNQFAGRLIRQLVLAVEEFREFSFKRFHADWSQYDLTFDKQIEIVSPHEVIHGRGMGVDLDGELKISTSKGIRKIRSGVVSLNLSGDDVSALE